MTAEQLRHYINQLAASGREQSQHRQLRCRREGRRRLAQPARARVPLLASGPRLAGVLQAPPRRPLGTRAPAVGGRPHRLLAAARRADKPWLLRGQDHGTQVVLLGQHERHDTTQAPPSVTDARRHWITRYLNGRFLRLPARGRGARPRTPRPRRARTAASRSTASSTTSSTTPSPQAPCELSDAIARWWVLDDDHRARRREATLWASTGHAAAVYGDELYDVLPQTRGGYGRLQDFGIRFGYERVVLHLEPQVQAGRLECNTARTLLLLDHEPLPWARWGEEFAAAMPAEILPLQERAASTDGVPRREAIRNRVSAILPLYRLSRYRPTPTSRRQTATRVGERRAAIDRPTRARQAPARQRTAGRATQRAHPPT